MKKVIKLKESDLVKIIRRVLNESDEPEPVFTEKVDACRASFLFGEGQTSFSNDISRRAKDFINGCIKDSIDTIKKFHNSSKFTLPPMVTFYVGTSSTGSFNTNEKIAKKRMDYLTTLYTEVMNSNGIRSDVAYKLLVQSNKSYTPSKLDTNFYDPSKVKPNDKERICHIVIEPITTMGKSRDSIGDISGKLIDASSIINTWFVDNVGEESIKDGIKKLQTYSDIKDLNDTMIDARKGDLESFLNDQLFDDLKVKKEIVNHLNYISRRSFKGEIAKIVGGYISIILT